MEYFSLIVHRNSHNKKYVSASDSASCQRSTADLRVIQFLAWKEQSGCAHEKPEAAALPLSLPVTSNFPHHSANKGV